LQGFQSGGFAVLVHQSVDGTDSVGDGLRAAEFPLAPWIGRFGLRRSTFDREISERIVQGVILPMGFEKRRDLATYKREHDIVYEAYVSDGPFDIEEHTSGVAKACFGADRISHDRSLGLDQRIVAGFRLRAWDIGSPEAHGAVIAVDSFLHVMGCPASDILEESDAADTSVIAQVEPMFHAAGDIDHITAFHGNAEHRPILRVQMKNASSFDGESDFVFRMGMFFVELLEHRIQVRGVGVHVDHVRRNVAPRGFDLFDLRPVFVEDIGIGGILGESSRDLPTFEPNSKGFEEIDDFVVFGQVSILRRNVNGRHGEFRNGFAEG
jgi:hypothetical protein